jgi:UDP-N-acetylmuramate dehydrogenase
VDVLDELRSRAEKVCVDEPLSKHCTLGVGGPADFYVEVATTQQLKAVWSWAKAQGLPLFLIGKGSNILISDKGVRGVVVHLRGEFEEISWEENRVRAGAGTSLPVLAKQCAERGWGGAEFMVGIPGTLGGGLLTNAGTPEGDLGSLVEQVKVLDVTGAEKVLSKNQLAFRYRSSTLAGQFVLAATLKLRRGNKTDSMARLRFQLKRRGEKQPLGTKNCGSVFKNPPGDHAARLIEGVGLKGFCLGGARFSPKHANFIENTGGASARDIHRLMEKACHLVREKFGLTLEPEVWSVGEK